MRRDYLKRFRRKLFRKVALAALVSILLLAIVMFLADTVLQDFLANMVSYLDRDLYLFLRGHKSQFFAGVFILILIAAVCFTISNASSYLNMIVDSIDKVFKKDEELIVLPDEFKDIETRLNSIKYDMLRNEQVAKEAEQRKNDLVVYLAHDLKTPLTSIIGYLILLNEEKDLPKERRERYVGISLEKAERLEGLINEFFEITRFNLQNIALEKSRINLSFLLDQLADEFYPILTTKNLVCKTHIESNLYIVGDADKLARVFDNLIRNAINYSYENTTIDIFAENVPLVLPEAGKDGQPAGVELRFRNRGDQIPESKINHIFQKFYRVDSSRTSKTGGAGLGLAITKQIVELHQGTIGAVSTLDYTEFRVFLPAEESTFKK